MAYPSDLTRTKNWGTETLTDSDLEGQLDLIINWAMAVVNASTGHTHDGTSNQGPKINITNLTVGSQAQGDIFYASSSSAWARLGAGTAGQALTTGGAAANPAWAGMTTEGDIEYRSSTTRTRLAKGSAYQELRINSGATAPEWATPPQMIAGSYTGDGTDNRSITVGFNITSVTPKYVLVVNNTDGGGHQFITGMTSGIALSDGTLQAAGIKSVSANTFVVGTDSNANGNTKAIKYWVWG